MNIKKNQIIFFQNNLLKWYRKNKRIFPWRKKGLSNYKLVIAEVLLQRTKAETISKFYPIFISNYPSWKSIANSSVIELEVSLKPIGLYKQRAKRLSDLAKEMVRRNGRFPKKRKELESIPFLGQYIANAILLMIHNKHKPLLDVNMARVLERFFGKRKKADIRYDKYLQELAQKIVNHPSSLEINWGILDFAQLVCKKRNHVCELCCIKKECLKNWNKVNHD